MQRVWFNKTFSSVAESIALIREADTASHYQILASNTKPHAAAYMAAHHALLEPRELTGEAYIEWCLRVCAEHEIGILVPGKEASQIAAHHARFESVGTRVLAAASADNLHLLHDKARFCAAVDLPLTPPAEFEVFENIEQFDHAYERLKLRHRVLCVKPSVSVYGIGFAVLEEQLSSTELLLSGRQYCINYDEFRRGLAALGTVKPMLIMEYLAGHEYSVDCLADHGQLICAIPRKKDAQSGQGQTIELRADIDASVAKLASDFQLNGIFNAQFREGATGLRLLEVNPRMSGGIAMACLAGPNLPYLALAGFDRGYAELSIPPIRDGIRVYQGLRTIELTRPDYL